MINHLLNFLAGGVDQISTSQLSDKLKTGQPVLLDVRTPEEFAGGHIPQAINIPLDKITDYQGDQTKEHLIICHSGARSLQACHALKKKGYAAINVSGGMVAWRGETIN